MVKIKWQISKERIPNKISYKLWDQNLSHGHIFLSPVSGTHIVTFHIEALHIWYEDGITSSVRRKHNCLYSWILNSYQQCISWHFCKKVFKSWKSQRNHTIILTNESETCCLVQTATRTAAKQKLNTVYETLTASLFPTYSSLKGKREMRATPSHTSGLTLNS